MDEVANMYASYACQHPITPKASEINMENTGYFVGWGTLSLINAGLAQSKGRSGLLWWLISLFIGPIATFLIVVLPRNLNSDL